MAYLCHPFRLLLDLNSQGTPSLSALALCPVASLLAPAIRACDGMEDQARPVALRGWARWILEARPDETLDAPSEVVVVSDATGFLAWQVDEFSDEFFTANNLEAAQRWMQGRGLLVPLRVDCSRRSTRPETRAFLESVESWQQAVFHVGGILEGIASTNSAPRPQNKGRFLRRLTDAWLNRWVIEGLANADLKAEIERRRRSGWKRPEKVISPNDPAVLLWKNWLLAADGAPGFCWWTWRAIGQFLNRPDTPQTEAREGVRNFGKRLGLRLVRNPIIRNCKREGDELVLTCIQSANPHNSLKENTRVLAAAYE